jgi:hypothetical protein
MFHFTFGIVKSANEMKKVKFFSELPDGSKVTSEQFQ